MSPTGDLPPSSESSPSTPSVSSLLTQADVGVIQFTSTGKILAVNDAFSDLTSYEREDLLGDSFSTFLPTVPPTFESLLKQDSPDRESVTLTLPIETIDGNVIGCESHFKTVSATEDGYEIVGILYEQSDSSGWIRSYHEPLSGQDGNTAPAKAFVALADALPDGIIVLDTASQIQYANPAIERILGYSPDELVGGSKLSIIPEHLREAHLTALNRYLETGTKNINWEYVELPGQHTDGHEVPLGISLNEFQFNGDRYFVGLFRDISPRKEAKQDLREREQRLNQYKKYTDHILNAIDDVFYVLDEAGNLQRWNQTLAEATGYSDGEIASMHALEFFEEDDQALITDAIEEGFETGTTRVEVPITTKDDESIPYEFVAVRLTDPNGKPVLTGIGRDISKQIEQRRKIEESERRYRTLAEHFPNGLVALFNEDLRYTAAGGELLTQLDIDLEEAIGASIQERYPEDLVEEVKPYFESALDGEEHSFEVEYSNRHLSAYTLPVTDYTDEISAGMLMVQDITERKEIQQQLEASNERLEQFAYAASHDLQEPLRMVISYLQLIESRYSDRLDEDGEEFLEFAVDGADRMRDMINGLLQYSRVDTQGEPLEPVDLNAILDEVGDDLQLKIADSNATIRTKDLPQVSGDRGQLRQVFQNLLTNAIEYSGDNPPEIEVSAEQDEEMWRISVQDNGIGIDPDETDHIFQVFQRLHTCDEYAGTGLGLALCQRIIERHGGCIWVESEPGDGSTFFFTLPDTHDQLQGIISS